MKKPSIEEVFSAGGVLSLSFPGFEHRPQQEVLAERVWYLPRRRRWRHPSSRGPHGDRQDPRPTGAVDLLVP